MWFLLFILVRLTKESASPSWRRTWITTSMTELLRSSPVFSVSSLRVASKILVPSCTFVIGSMHKTSRRAILLSVSYPIHFPIDIITNFSHKWVIWNSFFICPAHSIFCFFLSSYFLDLFILSKTLKYERVFKWMNILIIPQN